MKVSLFDDREDGLIPGELYLWTAKENGEEEKDPGKKVQMKHFFATPYLSESLGNGFVLPMKSLLIPLDVRTVDIVYDGQLCVEYRFLLGSVGTLKENLVRPYIWSELFGEFEEIEKRLLSCLRGPI
jgi:hypothetical protein